MLIFKILTFVLLYFNYANALEVNAFLYSSRFSDEFYHSLIKKFNKYSEENNLDISLTLNIGTGPSNATAENEFILKLFKKKSKKYDLYFYDNIYSANYGDNFLDLNEYLPKSHLDIFNNDIISNSCVYNDKLIGLPLQLYSSVLYSNKQLLKKYDKKIPKTWDELINTAKYILEKEKELGNTQLIGYNGLFSDDVTGSNSIYEFIYSFRNSVGDPFPEFTNSTVTDALEKLKIIKDEISSDEIFKSDVGYTINNMFTAKLLFVKFSYMSHIFDNIYEISPIPGNKSGISSSVISGQYLGIPNFISDSKKEAAVQVLKFLTSKETQKELLLERRDLYSGIPSLFDDQEFCSEINCKLMKNIQPVFIPITYDFDSFEKVLRESTYDYLYGDTSVEESLKKINNYLTEGNISGGVTTTPITTTTTTEYVTTTPVTTTPITTTTTTGYASPITINRSILSNLIRPTLTLPNLNRPTFTPPNLNRPTFNLSNLNRPTLNLSNLNKPTLNLSNLNKPTPINELLKNTALPTILSKLNPSNLNIPTPTLTNMPTHTNEPFLLNLSSRPTPINELLKNTALPTILSKLNRSNLKIPTFTNALPTNINGFTLPKLTSTATTLKSTPTNETTTKNDLETTNTTTKNDLETTNTTTTTTTTANGIKNH